MSRVERAILCALACGTVTYAAIWAGEWSSGGRLYLASIFSTAVLISTSPTLRQCHPARIVVSHVGSMMVGLIARMFFLPTPLTIAIAVGIALCFVVMFDALHPPAIANAAIALVAHETTPVLLALAAISSFMLAAAAAAAAALYNASAGQPLAPAGFWKRRRR
ncbi:HPP family protein [Sphingobium sp. EM0848]|uniref:HPP family protein n=1 Tax=Sphingobium sp. EM0848 TaxID=2743473 RepID=UPI00159C0860|nr:HPP family protein [Sphingobium sp. EM0848]